VRRFGFTLLMLAMLVGCAARQSEIQDANQDQALELPEIRHVTFQGHQQFSVGTLRKTMASQPRPFWLPWKRGEPYNRPTLEADLKRLRKYYFDRGFLKTQVTIAKEKLDKAKKTVDLTIAIDEGSPTQVKTVRIVGHVPPELPSDKRIVSTLALQAGNPIPKADFDRS